MRNAIIFAAVFMLSFTAQAKIKKANCEVYIPEKELNMYGYVARFDFRDLLKPNGYVETWNADEASYTLVFRAVEQEGPKLNRALGIIELQDKIGKSWMAQDTVTCLYQMCQLQDYAKALNRSYKKLKDMIPKCAQQK